MPETVHRGNRPLISIESSKRLPGRIVNVAHQDTPRASSLKPVMMRTIHLNHLSRIVLALSPLTMFPPPSTLLPISRLDEPLPQCLITDPHPVSLQQLLSGQSRTKILVLGPVQIQYLLFDLLRYLSL